jgi:hypothetical protein
MKGLKEIATIRESGVDGCVALIQGKLARGTSCKSAGSSPKSGSKGC